MLQWIQLYVYNTIYYFNSVLDNKLSNWNLFEQITAIIIKYVTGLIIKLFIRII